MQFSRTSHSTGPNSPEVVGIYEPDTGSIQYIVICTATGKAAIIDSVMGFDPRSAHITTNGVDQITAFVESEGLTVERILDTHPHADHLMASACLREKFGCANGIGKRVCKVAEIWLDYYGLDQGLEPEAHFDELYEDGDSFSIGELDVGVILTPGHTLASVTYLVGDDAAFVNDTFMQPDAGTSRADFPGGSADELYDSLQRILSLPDETRLFIGHDYGTDYRKMPEWEARVCDQRRHNKHVGGGVGRETFVRLRESRDNTLALPDRMLHVLQMNLRAGKQPGAENGAEAILRIPLNRF